MGQHCCAEGDGVSDACFVSWPLRPGVADELRYAVRDELAGADGRGVDPLLPGAATVSVFLRHPDREAPKLAWYVEHEEGSSWADPEAAIRDRSPLFPALARFLADGETVVVADSATGAVELVHAEVPGRPAAYTDQTDALPIVCSGGDADAASDASVANRPEVVPLVLRVRGGLGSLFARAFAGLLERTPAWLEAKFEAASIEVMEAEGMYTETLLLERTGAGYDLWWYMEAGDMAEVGEAYYASDSAVARVSEHVLGWVLERPKRALVHPVEASDFELLAHSVDTGRE